jgi:hypothetical protein
MFLLAPSAVLEKVSIQDEKAYAEYEQQLTGYVFHRSRTDNSNVVCFLLGNPQASEFYVDVTEHCPIFIGRWVKND